MANEQIKDLDLIVLVKEIGTNKLVSQQILNYNNPEDRKWLGRVTYRACMNNQYVQTMNKSDHKE